MKRETVTQIYLQAEEGMFLTNGEIVAKTVVVPSAADPGVWREITAAEAEKMMKAEEELL
jgi:hypothetical protein